MKKYLCLLLICSTCSANQVNDLLDGTKIERLDERVKRWREERSNSTLAPFCGYFTPLGKTREIVIKIKGLEWVPGQAQRVDWFLRSYVFHWDQEKGEFTLKQIESLRMYHFKQNLKKIWAWIKGNQPLIFTLIFVWLWSFIIFYLAYLLKY